jgi:RNA polymerase sigma-70 factor (ECF subfamily)
MTTTPVTSDLKETSDTLLSSTDAWTGNIHSKAWRKPGLGTTDVTKKATGAKLGTIGIASPEDLSADAAMASQGHFMDTCSLQDGIDVEFVVPAATDEVLVAAAKSGNHPAFVELWKRYSNTTFKVAYRITKSRDDADDVIQDAWMKAYIHLKAFDGRAKFSTWLTRIAINSALMTLRRRRAHPETSMEITDGETWQHREIADQTKDVEELYTRHERAEHLRRAICRLQPTLRNVVEIHQSNYHSVKEIAELAGISVAATKSRLLRARNILRRALG